MPLGSTFFYLCKTEIQSRLQISTKNSSDVEVPTIAANESQRRKGNGYNAGLLICNDFGGL